MGTMSRVFSWCIFLRHLLTHIPLLPQFCWRSPHTRCYYYGTECPEAKATLLDKIAGDTPKLFDQDGGVNKDSEDSIQTRWIHSKSRSWRRCCSDSNKAFSSRSESFFGFFFLQCGSLNDSRQFFFFLYLFGLPVFELLLSVFPIVEVVVLFLSLTIELFSCAFFFSCVTNQSWSLDTFFRRRTRFLSPSTLILFWQHLPFVFRLEFGAPSDHLRLFGSWNLSNSWQTTLDLYSYMILSI